jgi:hypothetical protein
LKERRAEKRTIESRQSPGRSLSSLLLQLRHQQQLRHLRLSDLPESALARAEHLRMHFASAVPLVVNQCPMPLASAVLILHPQAHKASSSAPCPSRVELMQPSSVQM